MCGIKGHPVVYFSIDMGMFTCKDCSPGGSTNGVGYTGIGKQHAFTGYPVDIRRFDQMIAVSTYGLVGMVVGHDKQDIWPLLVPLLF